VVCLLFVFFLAAAQEVEGCGCPCGCLAFVAGLVAFVAGVIGVVRLVKRGGAG
jgi:hypothetical protein